MRKHLEKQQKQPRFFYRLFYRYCVARASCGVRAVAVTGRNTGSCCPVCMRCLYRAAAKPHSGRLHIVPAILAARCGDLHESEDRSAIQLVISLRTKRITGARLLPHWSRRAFRPIKSYSSACGNGVRNALMNTRRSHRREMCVQALLQLMYTLEQVR